MTRSKMFTDPREKGATAVLVASTLLLLIGMAAVAIDLGAGWNERRQDQSASDVAAVAGGLSYASASNINQLMVTNALETARANLTTKYSSANDPAWVNAWRACQDPARLPTRLPEPTAWNLVATATPPTLDATGTKVINCISLSPSFFRVRTPFQNTATTFGKLLGVANLTTRADTIVTFNSGNNGLLPFAVAGDAKAGEICLDTGPTPVLPCDKNDKGSFGAILPPQFGNPGLPTAQQCSANGNSVAGVAQAIAIGIDHLIREYPTAGWLAAPFNNAPNNNSSNNDVLNSSVNMDLCQVQAGSFAAPADNSHAPDFFPINGVVIDTGNSTKPEITRGLVSNTSFAGGKPSKLQQGLTTKITVRSGNTTWLLDNVPLWTYLVPHNTGNDVGVTVRYGPAAGDNAPASCDPSHPGFTGGDALTRNEQMEDCLEDYVTYKGSGATVAIFQDVILNSPRFSVAPQLWHNNLGSGFTYRPVKTFRVVFLAGVYFAGQASSQAIWYPTLAGAAPTPGILCWDKGTLISDLTKCDNLSVDLVTAYLVPPNAYTPQVADWYPGLNPANLVPSIWK